MPKKSEPEWYKPRKYIHFDAPLSVPDAVALTTDPEAIANRSFWPLISFSIRERRWKKDKNRWKVKARPIAYASHADAHIFSYYSWKLREPYERLLELTGISPSVLAYRKIPVSSERGAKGKTSFHYAAEAFKAIATTGECDAVAMDIEKFFDSIPHTALKSSWAKLLNKPSLPEDDYAVFKAVTQFATVPLAQVRKARGLGKRRFAKERSIAMTSEEFDREIRKRGMINVNRTGVGIPQGLPISGLLANMVMFEIDEVMAKAAAAEGGSYRRYSDDILIIAPHGRATDLEALFKKQISLLPLSVQDSKTLRVRFRKSSNGTPVAVSMDSHGHEGKARAALQYLGLEFDGVSVLIRPQTLVKFGKRMRRSVDRARRAALRSMRRGGPAKINRRDLYARYSHLRPHVETPPKRRPRGSFMSYASHAADAVAEIGGSTSIEQQIRIQLRGQWSLLQRLITDAEKSLSAPVPKKSNP